MKKSIFPREQKRGSSLVNLNLFLFFVINDNICLGAKTQPSILEKGGGGEVLITIKASNVLNVGIELTTLDETMEIIEQMELENIIF